MMALLAVVLFALLCGAVGYRAGWSAGWRACEDEHVARRWRPEVDR